MSDSWIHSRLSNLILAGKEQNVYRTSSVLLNLKYELEIIGLSASDELY